MDSFPKKKQPREKTLSLETAHVYAGTGNFHVTGESWVKGKPDIGRELTAEELQAVRLGKELEALAGSMDFKTKRHILVDDVALAAAEKNSADAWRYQMFRETSYEGARLIYGADTVVGEGSLEGQARRMLEESKLKEKRSARIPTDTGVQRIKLRGFKDVEDEHFPSCDVLDVVWHEHKADEAEILLTILPATYKEQQARTHALVRELAAPKMKETSAATLLTDEKGIPVSLVVWGAESPAASLFFKAVREKYGL